MHSLRVRIPMLVSMAALVLLAAAWWIEQRQVLTSFLELERQQVLADLARAQEALASDVRFVGDYVSDWSGWDDTYRFLADGNPEFVASNLETNVFRPNSFDCLSMVDLQGKTVWSGAQSGAAAVRIDELSPEAWPMDHPLLWPRGVDDVATGILVTAHGPLLVASRPITDSARVAPPRGWIVMGRFLTSARQDALRLLTQLDLRIDVANDAARAQHAAGCQVQRRDATVLGTALVPGLRGHRDDLLLQVRAPRSVVAQGEAALAFAFGTTAFAVVLLFGLLAAVLQWAVVAPVAGLTRHALRIRASGDLQAKSGIVRHDEIGLLAREFDAMTERLAELQARSVQSARDRGMAEVAREVLHDVGNALQPVQAELGALRSRIGAGHGEDLGRVCELLRSHADELGSYLAHDAQGQQVAPFLDALAADIRQGDREQLVEIDQLARGLEHIRVLVDRHVRYAGIAVAEDVVPLLPLLQEAARLSVDGPADTARIDSTIDASVAVLGDAHTLLAVFVNLLRNARQAVRDAAPERRTILVRAAVVGERVCIEVQDRGRGIPPEHLERIFAGGFSTRSDGHGIGLHGCANRIRAMQGRLWATSDGADRGATFHVELPSAAPVAAAGVGR